MSYSAQLSSLELAVGQSTIGDNTVEVRYSSLYITLCEYVENGNSCWLKGVIGCDMHFYKLFELKCLGSVCTQPPYNDNGPPSVFIFKSR